VRDGSLRGGRANDELQQQTSSQRVTTGAHETVPIQAVAVGSAQHIGHFHYDIITGRWQWDDNLYLMHGYTPGEVEVTLDLILAHKHPQDRDKASATIEQALRHGQPFSAYQRIVTTDGTVRRVAKVGAGIVDEHDQVVAMDGFYVDLTPDVQQHADQAVLASAEKRATIEQAKGMVMLTYTIDADAAFEMLRWWSQHYNIKVATLAEQLVDAAAREQVTHPDVKLKVDRLLLDIAARAGE
jgi:PAS fold/ANTAR domain